MQKETQMIVVKRVSKKYKDLIAVDDISFEVRRGEIFAFLGPNGAGKSTTIKMLTTLLRPTYGEIRVNGYDIDRDQDAVRRSFGIVFQDPSLDDELTAWENMQFHAILYKIPTVIRDKRIEDLLRFVDLWDRRKAMVNTFSGGMKRRLEIARGLLHHPTILFLDEPTLGLDPQTRKHAWDYIQNVNQKEGMTVFFTTHYMEEAEQVAHRIAIIDHGKIIASGTSRELTAKTKTKTLEAAFLKLTGEAIRVEEVTSIERMRNRRKMHQR